MSKCYRPTSRPQIFILRPHHKQQKFIERGVFEATIVENRQHGYWILILDYQ
jgi:hypothetical protein